MNDTTYSDRVATLLSFACIAHCLALPLLAVTLPFAAALAEAEWVHQVLAVSAIAVSASVPIRDTSARNPSFFTPAILGSAFIASAIFADVLGIDETLATILGGMLLAFAHIKRLMR